MTATITSAERAESLRERARCLYSAAWYRRDGGQELTLEAMELEAEADDIDAHPSPRPAEGVE